MALYLSDHAGMFTMNCKTLEQAVKQMQREWELESDYMKQEYFGLKTPDFSQVKETVMYLHRQCETYTMEDRDCYECGESFRAKPRKTFVLYF